MIAYHCDGPGCDTWQNARAATFPQFLRLVQGSEVVAHFCCRWCLTRWGADNSEPTEVIA